MRRRALAAVALVCAALIMTASSATAATPRRGDLLLAPGSDARRDTDTGGIRVTAQPGGGVWASAIVTNHSHAPMTVAVRGEGAHGVAQWIRPAVPSVLLAAGEQTTIHFTIAPPRSAANGLVHAQLVVSVADAPTVTRTLGLVIDVLGAPAAVAPRANTATTGDAANAGATPTSKPGAVNLALAWAIVLALVVVAWRSVAPVLRRMLTMVRPADVALDVDDLNRLLDLDALNRELAAR
jgi:hypothetical protein